MSKAYDLISSFYTNLSLDVVGHLSPSEAVCFELSCEVIARKCAKAREATIVELTHIGKTFERCVITGERFRLPSGYEHLYANDGSMLPSLFNETFRWFFTTSGQPKCCLTWLLVEEDFERNKAVLADMNLARRFQILRQALLAFSKASDLECQINPEEEIAQFVKRMKRGFSITQLGPGFLRREFIYGVLPIARRLLREVLCEGEELCAPLAQWVEDPYGRHGPGAVASGETAREKWNLHEDSRIAERLFCNHDLLSTCEGGDERVTYVSRLAVVPKDVTKHRLICIEPKELMFAQQGLMKVLYDVISRSIFTRDAIHLFDQSHNFYASRDRGCATIDLKDASDLLTIEVAKLLFPRNFLKQVFRYRSEAIELPDGTLLENYEALATMGNALCFPLESLAFWSLTLGTILYRELEVGTYASLEELLWVISNNPIPLLKRFKARVFGDDIIAPYHYLPQICDILEFAGLVVNTSKTCSSITPARESCGSYWWGDYDVRVVKFSQSVSNTPTQFVGALAQLDQLREHGLSETANALSRTLEECQPFFDPERHSIAEGVKAGLIRYNPNLARLEKRSLSIREECGWVDLPGDVGLYAYFTDQATRTVGHSNTQRVKWSWVPLATDKR